MVAISQSSSDAKGFKSWAGIASTQCWDICVIERHILLSLQYLFHCRLLLFDPELVRHGAGIVKSKLLNGDIGVDLLLVRAGECDDISEKLGLKRAREVNRSGDLSVGEGLKLARRTAVLRERAF